MKQLIRLLILSQLFVLSGCYNMLEINDAVIAQNFSVDLLKNGDLAFYAQTTEPVARSETGEAQPIRNITVMGTGQTAAEAARNMFLDFPRIFLWIHSNTMFIGENLARNDLAYISDFLIRNRNTRLQAYVFVTHEAGVEEVLKVLNESPFGSCSARCISQQVIMLEEDLGYYVPLQTGELLEYMVTPGIEPVIPQVIIVKESGQEKLKFQGMAVVSNRRVIGSLDEIESQGYHYLRARKKTGGLVVIENPMEGVNRVSMEITSFSSKMRPEIRGDKLSMKVSINCELRYLEQAGTGNIYTPENQDLLESLARVQIEEQVKACIKKAQLLNSDILGWGLCTWRYEPEVWKEIEPLWHEIFPRLSSSIEVKGVLRKDQLAGTAFEFK